MTGDGGVGEAELAAILRRAGLRATTEQLARVAEVRRIMSEGLELLRRRLDDAGIPFEADVTDQNVGTAVDGDRY